MNRLIRFCPGAVIVSDTFLFVCPHCQHQLHLSTSVVGRKGKCPGCSQVTTIAAPTHAAPSTPQQPQYQQPIQQAPPTTNFQMMEMGHFIFAIPYDQAFSMVEQAMADCGAKIKKRLPEAGQMEGKCRYGINPFGMTVMALFFSDATGAHVEIKASFTDAFDTFGACKKKVRKISERLMSF
tara:strand:+ start:127 stop:669 length:543 start_codon:yes stop_codon:yes gene_type:complete